MISRVDSADYVAPVALRAVVIALCGGAGAGIAWAFGAGLGEHPRLKCTPWLQTTLSFVDVYCDD